MNMFCFQCQETAKGEGCMIKGVCGKSPAASNMMDVLIFGLKGLSYYSLKAEKTIEEKRKMGRFICDSLFMTITNVNFDEDTIREKVKEVIRFRDEIKSGLDEKAISDIIIPECAVWNYKTDVEIDRKALETGVLNTKNEDIRALRELIMYGIKGIAAYASHAAKLGFEDEKIYHFIQKGLVSTTDPELSADELFALVLECGKYGVETMALLDKANTSTYGNPEITEVNIGVRNNPGILISGHDLKDMEELLEQTKGTGVDVYTHSEMLPANYYPAFKKYGHFVGNYGNSWWKQNKEFEAFNGPVLMTTNCLTPPKDTYKDRVYTTDVVGFKGLKHIPDRKNGKPKNFSAIIEHAKKCAPPQELEKGSIIGGFAHNQVLELADKIVKAVKSIAIKKFIVMAGCDGRLKSRNYYTEFAEKLPSDTVILTAGCAKYRYNKLKLGDIEGIPRVLDAGQCNDSYSLAVTALKLKEVFELNDINDLPIAYNIAWYEQKAVIVLLALLSLGIKNIKLGPTLPAFLSPNVTKILIEKFNISGTADVDEDMKSMIQ